MNQLACVFALAASVSCFALSQSHAVASDASGLLLVVNKNDQTLGIVDPALGKQIATVALNENTGHEVAATPDGKLAFVPIFGSGGVGGPGTDGKLIRVIDLQKLETIRTIDLGKPARPHEALIGPKDGLLYVTTEVNSSVTVIDPKTYRVIREIPTGKDQSHMIALSKDGKRMFSSNVGSGTISVVDLENQKVDHMIKVADVAQRISLSPDDKWIFTSDQRKPRLAVINAQTDEIQWVTMPGTGYGSACTPDGKYLVIALPGVRKVGVLKIDGLEMVATLDVPRAPQEVLIRPDGAMAYVSCDASGKVAEIDLKEMKVGRLIDAGKGADGLAWAPGATLAKAK